MVKDINLIKLNTKEIETLKGGNPFSFRTIICDCNGAPAQEKATVDGSKPKSYFHDFEASHE